MLVGFILIIVTAGTIAGLQDEIKQGTKALTETIKSTVSVSSGCELFVRFITLTSRLGEEKVREGFSVLITITYMCPRPLFYPTVFSSQYII